MTITPAPSYRNTRQNYYTDKASDNHPLGAIVNTFKAITDVYDNQYTPLTAYTAVSGNANTPTNPEYQYPGYLYCDGSEYEISDFPALYSIIGNDYGGTARPGINLINGGSGYSSGSGSTIYTQIGLESYTQTHNAPILFTQTEDDTVGGGNQFTWLTDYYNAINAISANATATLTSVLYGGHEGFTKQTPDGVTLQTAIRTAFSSSAGTTAITAPTPFTITPASNQSATINGTSYPVMGRLYVPTSLGNSLDVVVAFHGTLEENPNGPDIIDAALTTLQSLTNQDTVNLRDKIIFSVAYPQDHISNTRQFNLGGVGTEESTFLMGDNLPWARAAVKWVKNDLNAYIAAQGGSQTINDVYLFGHSQGGKLVSKINTLDTGIAGVVANAPGPIQFDQTCSIAANAAGTTCSKVSAIHGPVGTGGSGTTITFDAAPAGGQTIQASLVVDPSGTVIGVNPTNLGLGYTSEPSYTINNAGGGSGLQLEINLNDDGAIESINQENVFNHWGESRSLGTFKVPDLKTRKVVGYGNVYGAGTPSIGLITLGAGANNGIVKQGGSWYFDKQSQSGYFALGSITTTGYTDIKDDVSTRIIGSQKVHVTMQERRLQRVPDHTHFVYHTAADETFQFRSAISGDRYLVDYSNANARLMGWSPIGGLHFQHKHGLSKSAIAERETATYDVFDWRGGAEGTGSIKYTSPDYYFASGGSSSGTWETVTETAPSMFRTFVGNPPPGTGSVIGGREIRTGGREILSYVQDNVYTGNSSISFPPAYKVMEVEIHGGGGSGSDGTQAGNDGNPVNFKVVAGSTLIDITANGGQGGGKSNNYTSGGDAGTVTKAGSNVNKGDFTFDQGMDGTAGQIGPGAGGKYPGASYPTNPNQAGTGGVGLHDSGNYGGGSDGVHTQLGGTPTSSSVNISAGSLQTVNLSTSSEFSEIKFIIRGGAGADSQQGTSPSFTTYNNVRGGVGSNGTVMTLEWKNPGATTNYQFQVQAGGQGSRSSGSNGDGQGGAGGSGYSNSGGKRGGDGATDDGGGGGGASVVLYGGSIIAGAGGGGGGGGLQNHPSYPYNGRDGRSASTLYSTIASGNLYTGGGSIGGNYGCVGGGGGGGGGGVSSSTSGGGGSGGIGGDPTGTGGAGGHGGGEGGRAGQSAANLTHFNFINATSSNGGQGSVTIEYTEDNSAWSPGGGGGGGGAYVLYKIEKDDMPGASGAQITFNQSAASGVGGTSNGQVPYARVGFGEVTGYEGGSVSTSVGDIIVDANDSTDIFASGAGNGAGGGFKLPTTQVPEVEFVGGGGTGAAATAVVSGEKVTSITLDNGGSGYDAAPVVRIKHGAGTRAFATATVDEATKIITSVALSPLLTPEAYNSGWGYVKLSGSDLVRYIVVKEADCTNVKRFNIKVARGNGLNGGNRPENGGDELKLYYNTDGSLNFTQFLGVIVPIPTAAEINTQYDGTGSGTNPTNWYWYGIDLPTAAQKPNVRFKIVQDRNPAGASNDNTGDTDHYGICDFIYEYNETTELKFIAAGGKMSATAIDRLSYEVEGAANAFYSSGATGNDATFTLSSQVALVPDAAIEPDINVPVVESYHLCKYLIKAF